LPQFNIFEPCLNANEYIAKHGERVTLVAPCGTAKKLYDELCSMPGLGGASRFQRRGGVWAIRKGIWDWEEATGVTLTDMLRLSENDFGRMEKSLLDAARSSVERYAASFDRKAEVEALLARPIEAHLRDHQEYLRTHANFESYIERYNV
jgi:hypothetical protein